MFHMVQRTAADAAAVWKRPSAQQAPMHHMHWLKLTLEVNRVSVAWASVMSGPELRERQPTKLEQIHIALNIVSSRVGSTGGLRIVQQ